MFSWVPPALISTRLPARVGANVLVRSTVRASSAITSGSSKRPGPVSLPVRRPCAGSSTVIPRSRSVATFACVAGLSHISVCMAGASTTGHVATRMVEVSRSSARPAAARAMKSAVAGATTIRSASCPTRTCCTSSTRVNTPVSTGLPLNASNVAAPTKLSAFCVGITRTLSPASLKFRTRWQALYAAIPPETPTTTRSGWDECGASLMSPKHTKPPPPSMIAGRRRTPAER